MIHSLEARAYRSEPIFNKVDRLIISNLLKRVMSRVDPIILWFNGVDFLFCRSKSPSTCCQPALLIDQANRSETSLVANRSLLAMEMLRAIALAAVFLAAGVKSEPLFEWLWPWNTDNSTTESPDTTTVTYTYDVHNPFPMTCLKKWAETWWARLRELIVEKWFWEIHISCLSMYQREGVWPSQNQYL